MPHVSLKALVSCATLLATFPLGAAPIFNDTFDSGIGSWVGASGVTIAINTGNVLGTGNSLAGTTGSSSVNLLALGFSSQTLANVGDSLSVAFDYRWVNATSTSPDRIPSFGLYNSNGAGDYADDFGYNVQYNPVTVKLQSENGTNNTALAGSDDISLSDGSIAYTYSAASVVRLTFTLERVVTGLKITTSLTPSGSDTPDVLLSTTTTAPLTYTFDEFLLRSRATNYYLDNVSIDFTPIPEPASAASLAGLMAFGLVAARRRRRSSTS